MKSLAKLFFFVCCCLLMAYVPKASAQTVRTSDIKTCNQWIKAKLGGPSQGKQVSGSSVAYPFSFIYNGKPSSELLSHWNIIRTVKKLDRNRQQVTLSFLDPKTKLEVRCQTVLYNDFPVVEWIVYLKNKGTNDSPILENIQALDTKFSRQASTIPEKEFYLNYNKGGCSDSSDFKPLRVRMDPDSSKTVGSFWGGFPTAENLPFFNVEWKIKNQNQGVIIAAGWPARWKVQFKRDNIQTLSALVGQMHTHMLLHPGEEIRTPLVALLFWSGDLTNSQNTWRRWMIAHNVPRQEGKLPKPMLEASNNAFFAEMFYANEDNQKQFIRRYIEEKIPIDYWWMDAGWYPNKGKDWQDLLGTWIVDKTRFPNGLKAVSDYTHEHGIKTLLWFEPERVMQDSWLFVNHPEWLLGQGNPRFLNFGNPKARQWATNHIDSVLISEKIDLYRQDFAVFSANYWDDEDTAHPDRQGITENKHVVGYLQYLDELLRRHPKMIIDICAAGGKRLELENLRRAVPLWRSDYAQQPVGIQAHSYGISSWIPFSGTGVGAIAPFDFRSEMCPSMLLKGIDVRNKNLDYALLRKLVKQWRMVAPDYYGDYYPLTPYSQEKDSWIGWEYYRPETGTGFIQLFRRTNAPEESKTVLLKGLDPKSEYKLIDFDNNQIVRISGRELLAKGMKFTLPEKPQAKLIRIEKIH